MAKRLEDIPKEELQEEAKFIAAVAEGLKQQPEGQIVLIDCPCGGKIKAIRSEYNGAPFPKKQTSKSEQKQKESQ